MRIRFNNSELGAGALIGWRGRFVLRLMAFGFCLVASQWPAAEVIAQTPEALPTSDPLKTAAYAELRELEALDRPLTAQDTEKFWRSTEALRQTGVEARPDVLNLYARLGTLDVDLRDRLEVARFVGQDHYFYGRFADAHAAFDRVRTAYEAASEQQRRALADKMANILYLRGNLLRDQSDLEQGWANDVELVSNPSMRAGMEMITLLTTLERIGDHLMGLERAKEAQPYFQEALELLGKHDDESERTRHTIRVSLKELRARGAASQFETEEFRAALRSLKEKYRVGDYAGFEQILQALVVADEKLEDADTLIADLKTLRTWYFKRLESNDDEARIQSQSWKRELAAASKLLIVTLLEQKQAAEAKRVFDETIRRVAPPAVWRAGLPAEWSQDSVLEDPPSSGKHEGSDR